MIDIRMRGAVFGNSLRAVRGKGFALPTILVASTVMLLVLSTTLVTVSSSTLVGMEERHNTMYAKGASQSGLAMAYACLRANGYSPTWSTANPLRPNTNCSGIVRSGVSAYIHNATDMRSTFVVSLPETVTAGVSRVAVLGRADRLTTAGGVAWRTYQDTMYATISSTTFRYGYVDDIDSYFDLAINESVRGKGGAL